MNKEGSIKAPKRHPIKFDHPDFLDPKKLDDEMRRVFDICHGCRRCFNLCDSFPKLFDMIDDSKNEDVESLPSNKFAPVVDSCTLDSSNLACLRVVVLHHGKVHHSLSPQGVLQCPGRDDKDGCVFISCHLSMLCILCMHCVCIGLCCLF
jgi:hypothetical protein